MIAQDLGNRLSQERERELLDIAMRALRSRDKAARDRTARIAEGYRELIALTERPMMQFSDLRAELRQQSTQFRKLAASIRGTLGPLELALPSLLAIEGRVNHQEISDALFERLGLANRLDEWAVDTDRLVALDSWPKGGRVNVAKAHYQSPNHWLADQCVKMFFNFGKPDDIQPTSPQRPSPFGKYADAVYELATGRFAVGVSLEKAINEAARQYRDNEIRNHHRKI